MYFNFIHSESTEDMGYSLSKLEIETGLFDGSSSNHGVAGTVRHDRPANCLDNEISQLTKLRSGPHENISSILAGKKEVPVSTFKMLAAQEANISGRGSFSKADCCHVLSEYLPVSCPWIVDQMETRAYISQFSADGSLFVAAFQVYATMSPIIYIVDVGSAATESVASITEIHDGLLLSADDDFGIFSVKFSTEGWEVVAGSSDDAIYVYDLEANKLSLWISADNSDVNSVCFADESGHLIYSGSNDNLCKVWDRRCFRAKEKPAGVLMGHLECVTFLDSQGMVVISFLIVKISPSSSGIFAKCLLMLLDHWSNIWFRNYEWDYRWMDYPPQARDVKHPYDQSIATYKGHSVLRTLIRCYFSPENSTGQRYIYTGSHDACIYIYDLLYYQGSFGMRDGIDKDIPPSISEITNPIILAQMVG